MIVQIICFECKKARNIKLTDWEDEGLEQQYLEFGHPGSVEPRVCKKYIFPCTKCSDFEPIGGAA